VFSRTQEEAAIDYIHCAFWEPFVSDFIHKTTCKIAAAVLPPLVRALMGGCGGGSS
jgi:hypothetical protein